MDIKFENKNVGLFLKRAAAYIIDNIIVFVSANIILFVLSFFVALSENVMANFTLLLWAAYYIYMLGKYGWTFGKKFLGLKVVKNDNTSINFKIALYRFFSTALSTLTLFVGFIMVLFNKKGFALHDKIAGTLVLDNALISLEETAQ